MRTTNLEHAVLGYPVSLDQYPLVQTRVVEARLHQRHCVILEIIQQVNIPHSTPLRAHPIRNSLVEVTKEAKNLLVQDTVLGDEWLRRSSPGETSNVVLIRILVLVHQLTLDTVRKII